ncbi:MAG TPA: DUF2950 domain-containing protein [Nitrospiraceae bacterium]|jgi:hypothetical protein|nr:DUF2950 domain-containing protein [Nitrospiraceae bacterium]
MEEEIMGRSETKPRKLAAFIVMIVVTSFGSPVSAQDIKQREFESPQGAFNSLVEAAKNNDTKELLAIFGPGSEDVISSGDVVADTQARQRFAKDAAGGVKFSKSDDKRVLVFVGKDGWCFPIPIVKSGKGWIFFTEDGKEEIINRRIGRNELNTIQVSLAYVDAQREYASKDRNGDGVLQYAQHFLSQKDKRDGLYWETASGEEISPLGPLIAHATEGGYTFRKGEKPSPYHGYYFKILKSQGSNAPGGELDYVVNGKMVKGFGLVAYPARYGVSGIMSFMVNQQGIIYEKDLGPKTEEIAKGITAYDPDKTWKKVEPTGTALP